MWGLIIKSARSEVAQNMWVAQLPSGCARGCLWCKFLHNYPGFMGHSPPSRQERAQDGDWEHLKPLSPLFLCQISVSVLPFHPEQGGNSSSSCWYLEDPGTGRIRGGVMEVVWGKRRELITNSSLGGWYFLGEIIFFKLPQSWASLNKPEHPRSSLRKTYGREKPAAEVPQGSRTDSLFPKLAKKIPFIPLWRIKTLQSLVFP